MAFGRWDGNEPPSGPYPQVPAPGGGLLVSLASWVEPAIGEEAVAKWLSR